MMSGAGAGGEPSGCCAAVSDKPKNAAPTDDEDGAAGDVFAPRPVDSEALDDSEAMSPPRPRRRQNIWTHQHTERSAVGGGLRGDRAGGGPAEERTLPVLTWPWRHAIAHDRTGTDSDASTWLDSELECRLTAGFKHACVPDYLRVNECGHLVVNRSALVCQPTVPSNAFSNAFSVSDIVPSNAFAALVSHEDETTVGK
jgi:hypothetical protein